MVARTPPANVRTIHTATKVPPVIAPITAHNIKISPGFFDFAFIATTANIIVRNENNNPINPNPAMPVDADVSIVEVTPTYERMELTVVFLNSQK